MNSHEEYKSGFLKVLKEFLANSKQQVNNFLSELGWTEKGILEKEEMVRCPLNPGHTMPPKTLQTHMETCKWLSRGYTRKEKEKDPPSSSFAYTNSTSVVPVAIDRPTQTQILTEAFLTGQLQSAPPNYQPDKDVPLTADRAITELTTEERLAIYDYVVARGKDSNRLTAIDLEELNVSFEKKQEPDKPKSHLEVLAEQRDYKRRRQSYRAKNVHITQKSYTEIMREVISNQTEMLHEMIKEESVDDDKHQEDSHHREPDRKRRRSSSSRDSSASKRHDHRGGSSRDDSRSHRHQHSHRHKKHRKHKKKHSHRDSEERHRSRNRD